MAYKLLKEPRFVAEATFKQTSRQSDVGLSLKEAYQHFFSGQSENATSVVMQSNAVLKDLVEALGLQMICNPQNSIKRAFKRIGDNLCLEFKRSISDPDLFLFHDVSYSGEKPLVLSLKLTSLTTYQVFDKSKKLVGEGILDEPFSMEGVKFTLHQLPKYAKLNQNYPLTIQTWQSCVANVRGRTTISLCKQDKTVLKLSHTSQDRFLAANILNALMQSYQTFLKKESDEGYQSQVAYLLQRQEELTQMYDAALAEHVQYLKDNIYKNGFVGADQELESLSQPKNLYSSRLFDVDLELQRLQATHLDPDDFELKKASLVEIEEAGVQIHAAKQLLESVESQEPIPSFPSLVKDPRSAIALLVRQIADARAMGENSTATITAFIVQLEQRQKMLEENLQLQTAESHDFSGLHLGTARELLAAYTRERDNLQAQLRELVFLREQIQRPDFEMSSLGGVFHDSVTGDLIHKASAIALQLKDESNRTAREQARLLESLHTQKEFLSQYLLQTIELKKLKGKLLTDKIGSLCKTTISLLQSEKELLKDKLDELNQRMSDLPEKWRRESLLMLKKELGAVMLQGVSHLAETKNLGQHIFLASARPLDAAIPPSAASPPRVLFFSLVSAVFAAFVCYSVLFCKSLFKGFPVSEENLKISGFPTCGSLSSHCSVNLGQLPPNDLETLRRIATFLATQPKKHEALMASCIGGRHPNYTHSLAEILALRGIRVLAVNCAFDQVVHPDDMPGLWQYLQDPLLDLPLRRNLMFDFLPCGGSTRQSAETISSTKFSSFLNNVKHKYDVVLLYSSADAYTSDGYAFLPLSDAMIVSVQKEQKDELLVYLDWAAKKGAPCATFVYLTPEK
jgi:hypothetical protein